MMTTERALGTVMAAGIVACVGLMFWNGGPREATAQPAVEPVPASLPVADGGGDEIRWFDSGFDSGPTEMAMPGLMVASPVTGDAPLAVSFAGSGGRDAPAVLALSQENTSRRAVVRGLVVSGFLADTNGDGALSVDDRDRFEDLLVQGDNRADLNHDGFIDMMDMAEFFTAFDQQERREEQVVLTTLRIRTRHVTLGEGSEPQVFIAEPLIIR